MTATVLLVRHAIPARFGSVLSGRGEDLPLSGEGREQSRRLAEMLTRVPVHAVYASPMSRTRETAEPVARRAGCDVQISAALNEIDFGDWTGREFSALRDDPAWTAWNTTRAACRPPNGESMAEAQARAVDETERLRRHHCGGCIVLVSHAEVIRAIVLHYLGLSLDAWMRIEIAPASVSRLVIGDWGARLNGLNEGVCP